MPNNRSSVVHRARHKLRRLLSERPGEKGGLLLGWTRPKP